MTETGLVERIMEMIRENVKEKLQEGREAALEFLHDITTKIENQLGKLATDTANVEDEAEAKDKGDAA